MLRYGRYLAGLETYPGAQFITDVTNASRTMLFNIRTLQWDQELLDLFYDTCLDVTASESL